MHNKETIAVIKVKYENDIYIFYYNFGENYPHDAAEFMFTEGNYACDCNLSQFIQQECNPDFKEIDHCGHQIEVMEISFK